MHGKVSAIGHAGGGCLSGLPSPFLACRYHSLVVDRDSLPAELELTAWTDDGLVMGLRHRTWPVEGVQFHPEAILTEHGHRLLDNWLRSLAPAAAAQPEAAVTQR
jgi:anthranilate synthase/aminodeoxychorismate synthase-like glutamine amidotransferase